MVIVILVICIAAILAVVLKKITVSAALAGGVIALTIYYSVGFIGLVELAAFFLLGTFTTGFKMKEKNQLNISEENIGTRSFGQVFANCGAAFLLSIFFLIFTFDKQLICIMIAGSFAAAIADTLSSELGNIYGRKFYCILNFRKSQKGLNGVVSLEGTLIGFSGSCLIGGVHMLASLQSRDFIIIVIAGTIGNLVDSILGATLENSNIFNNNQVNFINTISGAVAAGLLYSLL